MFCDFFDRSSKLTAPAQGNRRELGAGGSGRVLSDLENAGMPLMVPISKSLCALRGIGRG